MSEQGSQEKNNERIMAASMETVAKLEAKQNVATAKIRALIEAVIAVNPELVAERLKECQADKLDINMEVLYDPKEPTSNITAMRAAVQIMPTDNPKGLAIIKHLVDNKGNPYQPNSDGYAPHHEAASRGHIGALKLFKSSEHKNAATQGKNGRTALHCFITTTFRIPKSDRTETLNILLTQVNANLTDQQGNTALHLAIMGDKRASIATLAPVTDLTKFDYVAVAQKRGSTEVAEQLAKMVSEQSPRVETVVKDSAKAKESYRPKAFVFMADEHCRLTQPAPKTAILLVAEQSRFFSTERRQIACHQKAEQGVARQAAPLLRQAMRVVR